LGLVVGCEVKERYSAGRAILLVLSNLST